MKGRIKNYYANKGYGFIEDLRGKEYFFHRSNWWDNGDIKRGMIVRFNPETTEKGDIAVKINIIKNSYPSEPISAYKSRDTSSNRNSFFAGGNRKYYVPTEVLISRGRTVKGWELVELGEWIIHASSDDSPDDAKDKIKAIAQEIGATAIVEIRYYKTTGASGNYKYTVHNFKGRIANIGKPSMQGNHERADLSRLNEFATKLNTLLIEKTNKSMLDAKKKKNRLRFVATIFIFLFFPIAIVLFLFSFFISHTDYTKRLEYSPIN